MLKNNWGKVQQELPTISRLNRSALAAFPLKVMFGGWDALPMNFALVPNLSKVKHLDRSFTTLSKVLLRNSLLRLNIQNGFKI